jgi:hypothetical protein
MMTRSHFLRKLFLPRSATLKESAMDKFLEKFKGEVNGVLSGWDRIAVRGSIRWLSSTRGLLTYMATNHLLLKQFADWASGFTARVRCACGLLADEMNIPAVYLNSSSKCKEDVARKIAAERRVETGPICMISVVEPSFSPTVVGNQETKRLEVQMRQRKCVWIYFYWNDPILGFGHLRLQSWLPFTIKGNLNGHDWLERSLIKEQIRYIKSDNCFRWIQQPERAQQLLDEQLRTNWPNLLNGLVDQYFPIVRKLFANPLEYYWSADETELSTDVMFVDTKTLDRHFPMFARHALTVTDSARVMRYLGRIAPDAPLPAHVTRDIRGDRVRRYEGLCVKHRDGANSVKCYNKAGNVLRVETTINATRAFKVFRPANDAPERRPAWQPMRKGVADLQRRAAVSRSSNSRYLDALAACPTDPTLLEILQPVCQRAQRDQRRVRALNPCSPGDYHLLKFLGQAQWAINGLRNRDLAAWIAPGSNELSDSDHKRLTARTTRVLAILRAHGLIRKVQRTHRYIVTHKGNAVATLITIASVAQTKTLMDAAA